MSKSYFEVVTEDRVLKATLKGYWKDSIVDEIGPAIVEAFKKAADSIPQDKFLVLVDMSQFGQPTEKAKYYLEQCMAYGLTHGVHQAVEIVPKTLLKMGLDQAAKNVSKDLPRIIAKTHQEAETILAKLKAELAQVA
ncbi:MAG: hypothetical protein KI790_17935 [Cyclobacteriaceae bacterium]|nr:hypothetical protein [Cyclobacteriaceae bacterium HetDA_MAG_MS6]